MMRKFLLICGFAVPLCAALPPLAQSSRELQAIFSDPYVGRLNSAHAIQQIQRVDGGYLIMTQAQAMRVDIEYISTHAIGPISFKLHFHEPVSVTPPKPGRSCSSPVAKE